MDWERRRRRRGGDSSNSNSRLLRLTDYYCGCMRACINSLFPRKLDATLLARMEVTPLIWGKARKVQIAFVDMKLFVAP